MKEAWASPSGQSRPYGVRRGSGEKRKRSWRGQAAAIARREPSGKGTVSPTQAGRTGDAAELRGHPRRRLRDHREPCPVGSLHGFDLGKPSACSLRGAADDCVRPPVSLRPSIPADTRSCCHPWRPGAAAAGGEAGPASHPLLPGKPRIWDQQARDLLKTPKADFKHNQIARAKPSLPSDSFKCHKRCVAAKIAAPLNGPIICSAQSHKFPHPGIST